MQLGFAFFFNNILLGTGLAMDAFSVSLANGLNEPNMKRRKMCGIAGIFAFFQAIMPIIGWICVHTIAQYFELFEKLIPWITLILLGYIGGKMLYDGIKNEDGQKEGSAVGFVVLLIQGVATSIDALSAGFAIADCNLMSALLAGLVIGIITFVICMGGLIIGRVTGTRFAGKAGVLGGLILLFIGIRIFLTGCFS